MFDFNKCSFENCNDFSLSGSEFCINHIGDPESFINELIAKITSESVHKDIKASGCHFSKTKMNGRIFNVCNFSKCIFEDTDFSGSQFRLCFFEKAVFRNCSFKNTNMKYCAFPMAEFQNCNFTGSDIINTSFAASKITDSDFSESDLYFSVYINAVINDSKFMDCNVKRANFWGTKRVNVSFKYSNFEEALFSLEDA